MELSQLIGYNMRNVFLEKSYAKWDRDTIPRPSSKNRNWAYFWINSLKFYRVCFYFLPSSELSKFIETKQQTTCFIVIYSILKNKNRSGITTMDIIFWEFCLLYKILFSPQVKRSVIISNKYGIYELPYKLIFEEKYLSSYILLIDQI